MPLGEEMMKMNLRLSLCSRNSCKWEILERNSTLELCMVSCEVGKSQMDEPGCVWTELEVLKAN